MVSITLWSPRAQKPIIVHTSDGFTLVLSKIENAVASDNGLAMFSYPNTTGLFYLSARLLTECVVVVSEIEPEEVQQ